MQTLASTCSAESNVNGRPFRVLQLVDSLERGGIETWLLNMLGAVPRTDYIFDICCKGSRCGSLEPVAIAHGARVHHVAMRKRPYAFVRSLANLLKNERYDLLHSHVNSHNGLAVHAARLADVPAVASFHNERLIGRTRLTDLPGMKSLCRSYCKWSVGYTSKHARMVTPVSNAVLNSLTEFASLPDSRTQVLYLGAGSPKELTRAEKIQLRASLGIGEDVPLMLHVGSFTPQKNHRDLLSIFQQVKRQRGEVQLLLVGDGPEREFVESLISREGIRDIQLLGLRNDVDALMAISNVFVLPSLHEGLPIVLMEAAAASLPVVASRIPSVAEAIDDGTSGLLAPVSDLTQFTHHVLRILAEPELGRRMGAEARSDYLQKFSLESSAVRLTDLYSQILIQ